MLRHPLSAFTALAACLLCAVPVHAGKLAGKIFHVDEANRSFELLKETDYDPKTDIGRSRLTVQWTEKTTIRKVTDAAGIPHHQPIPPSELAKGFWQATATGSETDGSFVIEQMDVTPLPDPRATDDPMLPRVLFVGDSISMNYHEAAKSALAGIANYHRNDGNAASSAQGVRNMELWLGNYRDKGFHWNVIQFNHGLHDLKQPYDEATGRWGGHDMKPDWFRNPKLVDFVIRQAKQAP